MSKIIFLNGCGSSGKTSIARSIQHLSEELWLTFGVDTFISMLPFTKEEKYFSFIPDINEHGHASRVETTKKGSDFFGISPSFAKLIVDRGNNLIIDEVLFNDEQLKLYACALEHYTVYYVGVLCDLKTMQEREILRRDRCVGLSRDQINRVHLGLRAAYDLKVDTSNISPFEAARKILDYTRRNPNPTSFQEFILRSKTCT